MNLSETKIIFEQSVPNRKGVPVPEIDVPSKNLADLLGAENLREDLILPEVSELQTVRHFTNLSQKNYGIDKGFYPLGSCTMKYNPRINEVVASHEGFTELHPNMPEVCVQGALEVLYEVGEYLKAITGFKAISMQPVAGAHGELTSLMVIKAYHESRGEGDKRKVVLIPDSAHGTNPASAARCGYSVKTIKTDADGNTDLKDLADNINENVAAMMLTNPSTLALFEPNIKAICDMLHKAGAKVFMDGANMNAILGIARPGDMGFDCMHLNMHKTFSTPHGGGGPGCGAIGVAEDLEPFLPVPIITKNGSQYTMDYDRPQSIGKIHSYYGNFLMTVRSWAYIRAYGGEKLREIAQYAVLNANYVKAKLADAFPSVNNRTCMHECVLTGLPYKKYGVRTLDIAKRLMDYGYHPMTIYFPLIAPEAIMIEPTETECKETIDAFCDAMLAIANEAKENPDLVHNAPHTTVVSRLDEASAARQPDLRWKAK